MGVKGQTKPRMQKLYTPKEKDGMIGLTIKSRWTFSPRMSCRLAEEISHAVLSCV
jgi:hypothetical protein